MCLVWCGGGVRDVGVVEVILYVLVEVVPDII